MQILAVIVGLLAVVSIVARYAPQWWIGSVVILAFGCFPTFIPQQIVLAGLRVYLHEVPLFLAALYLLIYRPPNRNTDWCAAVIGAIVVAGLLHGFWNDYDLKAILNDSRGSVALALCVFVVGRIAWTPEAQIAMKAIKITLWLSFGVVLLGSLGIIQVGARTEDASLTGAAYHDIAGVTRVLGPTTHLATAVLGIAAAIWAIKPDLAKRTLAYAVPALGITFLAFSRNALLVIGLALLLSPIFDRIRGGEEGRRTHSGLLRAVFVAVIGVVAFRLVGAFLSLTAGIPGLDYVRFIYSAYVSRVLEGLTSTAREYDSSLLYRQVEVEWLKRALPGNGLFGYGFGFHYRPPVGEGFTATSRTYYAHHFYWWAAVKVGWVGLIAYLAAFLAPVLNALTAPGRFALRSSAAGVVVGQLVALTAVPLPEDVYGALALGVALGIAMLRAPSKAQGDGDLPQSLPAFRSAA